MANFMTGEWNWMPSLPGLGRDTTPPTMPTDDTTAQLLLKRRLAQADALRNQEMPQGQMVSGHYVAPSWTQYLANAVGKYQANAGEREAMKQYGEYETNKQKRLADALEQYNKDIADRTVQSEQQAPTITGSTGEMAPNMGMVNAPARTVPVSAADRYNALMKYSAATQNPELTQRAMLGGIEFANKQADVKSEREYAELMHKRDRGEKLSDTESTRLFELDKMKKEQAFTSGENAKSRATQMAIHNASAKAPPSGYQWGANGSLVPIAGGPADPNTKPLTADQSNARIFGTRMEHSNKIATDLEGDLSKPGAKLQYNPIATRAIVTGPKGISDITYGASDAKTQSAATAMRDFINAALRRESGAAISASEYDSAIQNYFPQPGESPEVTAQKRKNREIVISGMREAGGYPRGSSSQDGWSIEKVPH